MLLVYKDISHMPITELENDSESIRVKVFANKTSHWYRPPGSTSEEFQLFREQLDYIRTHHKGKHLPSAHGLGDFNFKDMDWPDRLSKSGSTLSQSEGQILIDIMNDHGLEQMVHLPTRDNNINHNIQNLAYQLKSMLETLGINYLWTNQQTNELCLPIIKQRILDQYYQFGMVI